MPLGAAGGGSVLREHAPRHAAWAEAAQAWYSSERQRRTKAAAVRWVAAEVQDEEDADAAAATAQAAAAAGLATAMDAELHEIGKSGM